jgi:hypothetical protein
MPKIVKKYGKTALVLALMLVLLAVYIAIPEGQAASISSRKITVSDSRPSQASVRYTFTGTHTASSTKCLKIQFCQAASGSCTIPNNMAVTAASATSTGWNGWTYAGSVNWSAGFATSATGFQYTSATGESGGAGYAFSGAGITNSDTAGIYYAWVNTYNDTDCASSALDSGVAAFAIISGVSVTATVNESLSFAITGLASTTSCKTAVTSTVTTLATSVPFGTLSVSANAIGCQTLTVSTNAASGYTTTAAYTQKLLSGSDDIDDWTGTNANPTAFSAAGTEAFGYTSNDTSLGTGTTTRFGDNNVWAGFSTTQTEVAYSASAVNAQATIIGYEAGISGLTAAGSYSTTVVYVTTPTY